MAANWYHEDRALTACRLLVAGNCLYGVDKNPLAVDLARVSLWLATAAADHPLTFLDHRLQVGDSLLGLPLYVGDRSRNQKPICSNRNASPAAPPKTSKRQERPPPLSGRGPMMRNYQLGPLGNSGNDAPRHEGFAEQMAQ